MNLLEQSKLQLQCSPLFKNLSAVELTFLTDNLKYCTYRKGNDIRIAYDATQYLYFIISGKVKLCEIDESGEQLCKEVLYAHDFFGELATNGEAPSFEYAEAISDTVLLCKIPMVVVKDIMRTNPNFSFEFTRGVWQRYRNIEKRFMNVACLKDVKTRLIYFFRDWAGREGKHHGNTVKIENYLTHKEIANLIGCTRVTVTTILNELRTAGNINYSKQHIEITDMKKFMAA